MNKPQFQKGDLVRWKNVVDDEYIGVVVELGRDADLKTGPNDVPIAGSPYALVHWVKGIETKIYERHNTWHGVIIIARAEEI